MTETRRLSADREITAEACAWVAQLESGDLSASDLAALREWMGRSPSHAAEIKAIADLSGQLSVLTEMAEPVAKAAATTSRLRRRSWGRPILGAGLAAAAALALVLVVGVRSPETVPIVTTPAAPATAMEMPSASPYTWAVSMPIKGEMSASSDAARMARPA